jgi:flagellar biosynthesis/type III secretory pathway protein FliH
VFLKEIRDNALAAGREEGLEQGLEQGREQGREEGMARILGAQIQARFGKLPAWAGQRLGRASAAQLERWGRKLLDAKTLEEVIGKRHA